jgi:hypothetical protein
MDWVTPALRHAVTNRLPVYSPPWSGVEQHPRTAPPRIAMATHSAARASSASWWMPMANPTQCRECRSSTAASRSLPSSVGISVRSPHQRTSGAEGGVKSRRGPSSALRADLSGLVVPRRRRAACHQTLLGHQRRDGVLRYPPVHGAQVRADPRRPRRSPGVWRTGRRSSPPTPPAVSDVVIDLPCATCETTPATPPAPGTTPRAGCHAGPSGGRSARPGAPPHRFLDSKGSRALEHIALHRELRVLLAQPVQLVPFTLAQRAFAIARTPVQVHPPTPLPAASDSASWASCSACSDWSARLAHALSERTSGASLAAGAPLAVESVRLLGVSAHRLRGHLRRRHPILSTSGSVHSWNVSVVRPSWVAA